MLIAGIVIMVLSLWHLSIQRDLERRKGLNLPWYNYHDFAKATWALAPIGIFIGILLIILGLVRC